MWITIIKINYVAGDGLMSCWPTASAIDELANCVINERIDVNRCIRMSILLCRILHDSIKL